MQHTDEVTGRLEDWVVDNYAKDYFLVWGNIYDDVHKRWAEGTMIHTSRIEVTNHNPTTLKEGDIISTLNSKYLLGKPGR